VRGMEVAVAGSAAASLVAVCCARGRPSVARRLNFHVSHQSCSDGSLLPRFWAASAIEAGAGASVTGSPHRPWRRCASPDRRRRLERPSPSFGALEISCLLEGVWLACARLGFDLGAMAALAHLPGCRVGGCACSCRPVRLSKRIHASAGSGSGWPTRPAIAPLPAVDTVPAGQPWDFDGAEAFYDYEQSPAGRPPPLVCAAIAVKLRPRLPAQFAVLQNTHGLKALAR